MFDTIIFPILVVLIIGCLSGIMLSVASKFFAVKTDERISQVRAELPGANCGACGYSGCDAYAAAIVAGAKTNLCVPGGSAAAQKVSAIMGVASEEVVAKVAVVKCTGNKNVAGYVMDYQGPKTCLACNSFYQGSRSCSHGCLGYGDCVEACQYDAISIVDGVAVVDRTRCTGCGMCAKQCPNHLIEIVPATARAFVGCSSCDKGAYTRKVCKVGCIGCKKCERTCPNGAAKVVNNLATIDVNLCVNCGECAKQCPTGAIQFCMPKLVNTQS